MALLDDPQAAAPAPPGDPAPAGNQLKTFLGEDQPTQEEERKPRLRLVSDRPKNVRDDATAHFTQANKLLKWADSVNIAKDLGEDELSHIGERVYREWKVDELSRSEWKTRTEKAQDIALQVAKEKSYPWPKASNVLFPLMTNAALQFAARAYPAIVSGNQVVRGSIVGDDDGEPLINPQTHQPVVNPQTRQPMMMVAPGAKKERALRIGEHMSWQLLDEDPESTWEAETDQLLHMLPIVGCVFRKSYFDPSLGRNSSRLVSALSLTINWKAKNVTSAPRATERIPVYPNEIVEHVRSGAFIDHEYGRAPDAGDDDDAPHWFLEQHRRLDLDQDGYDEPYTVTIHEETRKVARIVARYDADSIFYRNARMGMRQISVAELRGARSKGVNLPDEAFAEMKLARIDAIHSYTQYDFFPPMDGGPYGTGFGNLLAPINEAINTSLNMMLDAGHLQNTGGGFIGKGMSMAAGAVRFQIGEWKPINVPGGSLKDNLVPVPFPGPSPVLFNLLSLLIDAGKEIAAIKDILSGETPNAQMAATTVLALVEQGLKVFTAIYKRVYRALKAEFQKLYRLNRINQPNEGLRFRRGEKQFNLQPGDYADDMGVEPVSDPNTVSPMQKLARAQLLMSLQGDPQFGRLQNGQATLKRIYEYAMIEKSDELMLPVPPPDPVMLAEAAKLQMKAQELAADGTRQKQAGLRDLAQAILYLAQAKKTEAGLPLAFFETQLTAMQHDFEVQQAALDHEMRQRELAAQQQAQPAQAA
jgi:chaperonin GroES